MKTTHFFYVIIFFISTCTINSSSNSPYAQELHQLIKSGSSGKLKTFFEVHPDLINVSVSDEYPHPPLSHYLIWHSSNTSEQDVCNTVEMLINLGADVNTIPACAFKHGNLRPAIMIAIDHYKSTRLLEILFSNGASCNTQDEYGTLLQYLISRMAVMADKHFLLLIEKTLQYGADPYIKSTNHYFKNNQKVDCFEVIKKCKEDFSRCIRLYNNNDPSCVLDRYDYENACCTLKYLDQAEKLLKTKYIAPIKIIKNHRRIHLTYNFELYDNK